MRLFTPLLLTILGSLQISVNCIAAPLPLATPNVPCAPPATPRQKVTSGPESGGPQPKPLGVTPYSIGQPTDEEQLYLEYLNRMRVNPTAEGQRLATTTDLEVLSAYNQYGVDLAQMQIEFATNPVVPPLAMNANLLNAARWHSGDMLTNQYQGHYQTNGTTVLDPGQRMALNGYNASSLGENVFASATSVFDGHAAFAVDWGSGPNGMQADLGHRNNMLSAWFREVGVGVVDATIGHFGPQSVTQDFGAQSSGSPFITGVVYLDVNGNGFYDIGEGIGGVQVNTPGSTYFAVTADSGGYAIPVSTNGNYVVTFTAAGLSNQVVAAVSSAQNVKVDYSPAYSPALTGPNPAVLNQGNVYTIAAVPAATGYQWQQVQLVPYTLIEGAENGLGNVTVVSSPGYSVIASAPKASGNFSFNLAHESPVDQILTLNPVLLVSANSQLTFSELLGYAFTNEVAEAQVSSDSGSSWQTVWSKAGNDGNSLNDSGFVNQVVPLGQYAGQTLQVRFVYAIGSGFYYPSGSDQGFYIDDIAVSSADQLTGAVTNNVVSGRSFTFSPTSASDYLLQARAQVNNRVLPWGTALVLSTTSSSSSPTVQITATPVISNGTVQIDFTVANYRTGMMLQLLEASDLAGTWTQDASANLQTIVGNSTFRFTTALKPGHFFFKIKGT